jgi:hypothetical protein
MVGGDRMRSQGMAGAGPVNPHSITAGRDGTNERERQRELPVNCRPTV